MINYLSKLWYILKGSRRELPILLATFILSSVLEAFGIGLIGPFLRIAEDPSQANNIPVLKTIYSTQQFTNDSDFIVLLALSIIIIFLLKSIIYFLARAYIFKFSFAQKARISVLLMDGYLSAPYTFLLRKNSSGAVKNIVIETGKLVNNSLSPGLELVSNLTVITIIVYILATTDITLLAIIMGVFLPIFFIFSSARRRVKQWGQDWSESNQEMIRIINHGLGSLKETRIIGCEPYFNNQLQAQALKFSRASVYFNSFNILPRIVIETFLVVVIMLFIVLADILYGISIQEVTSTLAVFAVASIRIIPATSQIVQSIGKMQNVSYALDMLYWDLKEIETTNTSRALGALVRDRDKCRSYLTFKEKIALKDICYQYPESADLAIKDISLSIKKGESIAFIGKSGAGKTTLVDIILGLLQPQQGDITVDGVSIYENMSAWRNLVGYIPQSIFILDDTIEHNIAFGVANEDIDQTRLWKAIERAQLKELVDSLPNGIDTSVGERGVRLSGGQRQRIGIARALYHEREALVLDEATAALDTDTERLVTDAINALAGSKTLIIIAHRLSTVEKCDVIYYLENGNLISSGTYDDIVLRDKDKKYA